MNETPSDADLRIMLAHFARAEVAAAFGVHPGVVSRWIAAMKAREELPARGEVPVNWAHRRDEVIGRCLDKIEHFALVLEFHEARDIERQTKAAFELAKFLRESDPAQTDRTRVSREGLLERAKRASASADRFRIVRNADEKSA